MSRPIKLTTTYDHPIEDVWDALTNKEAMSEWLMPCNIEPVVGHEFQFKTKPNPVFDGIVHCRILEVIPNKKLSFSWSGGPVQNTVVVFELTAVGNKTEMKFEHSGFRGLFTRILVRNILSRGWRRKILTILLPKYLNK